MPRSLSRRFRRVLGLIDRAEQARRPKRAKRRVERVGRKLGRSVAIVDRGALSRGCSDALHAMLADGRARAERLAPQL